MIKIIGIVAGEPNSISSEIIFKVWKLRKKFFHKPFLIIGSINLLNKQKKKLKHKIMIKEINSNFTIKDLKTNSLPVYNINFKQEKPFEKISTKSNKYVFKCFKVAINLIKKNKIQGLINCPISKEHLLKNKYNGVTEFLSKKFNTKDKEVMLIFNKKLSISPLTTHIPLNQVPKQISKKGILKKIKVISKFYKKILKKNPTIGILGLNPHNFSTERQSAENKIIIPAINTLRRNKVKIVGPISPDTSFSTYKKYNLDVIFGMYHDQILTPFKALFGFNAVNVTLGLPFIRTSPDHGVAVDITKKNIANPKSLLESIKFFNHI